VPWVEVIALKCDGKQRTFVVMGGGKKLKKGLATELVL
jgi:hypothetical protein